MKTTQISLLLALLCCLSCQTDQPASEQAATVYTRPLQIGASGNMQYIAQVLAQVFTLDTNTPFEVTIGSSTDLGERIKKDTLFDFLLSTDLPFLDSLYQTNLSITAPQTIAYGKLVLWTTKSGIVPDLESLRSAGMQQIALPDPATNAYGAAIQSVLEKEQMLAFLEGRLVYQQDLLETNESILNGSVDVGFTAKSMVLAPQYTETGSWIEVDDRLYDLVPHYLIRVQKTDTTHPASDAFEAFLLSQRAKDILANFGFIPN
jgi:molybdate transport system substrate-binding protein